MKRKKVLIAMDYNPTAQKVAEAGYAMASAMNAEVILFHVISDPVYYSSPEYSPIMGFAGYLGVGVVQLTVDDLEKESYRFLEKSKLHLHDETIKTMVGGGEFAESILSTAKDIHADIIVLGSHSRRWLEEILVGSVAEKVLRHSAIPLFIVPTRQKK